MTATNDSCETKIPQQKVPPKKTPDSGNFKRRQDTATRTTTDDNKRKRQRNKSGKKGPPAAPPATVVQPAQPPATQPAQNPQDICVRSLFHKADATIMFPGTCKPGCKRNHNPKLRNGKLSPTDKAAVLVSLGAMNGKFADLAIQELDRMF
jgi:hypothetical protein